MRLAVNILQQSVNIVLVKTVSPCSLVPFGPRAYAGVVLMNLLGYITLSVIVCEHYKITSKHCSNKTIKVKTVSAYSLVPFGPWVPAGTVFVTVHRISLKMIFSEHFKAVSKHSSIIPIEVKTETAWHHLVPVNLQMQYWFLLAIRPCI